jgi:solute:Na+ symporter, SSS family
VPDIQLHIVDYLIAAAYVVGILAVGFWVGRGKGDTEAYFLAGRNTPWPVIGFSLMAANLSGTSYIGLAGAGYADGISVWNYEWMATVVLVLFALFVLPIYLRTRIGTVPELLERRYGGHSRKVFSALTILTAMFIDAAGAMYVGATVLQLLFPGIPLQVLIVAVAVSAGLYVLLGGLTAVLVTDTIQAILLLVAGGAIFFVGLSAMGGSLDAIRAVAPPGGWTVAKPADDPFLPWPGLFTGVLWLGFYYWGTNHVVVQKVLSARDADHGRRGVLFCALLQLPTLFLLILPGTMGRAFFPDLPAPDMIWPALAFDFLPIGLRGVVLAALIAALMSTLDSALNGAAALVTHDFIATGGRQPDGKKLLLFGRLLVAGFTVLAAAWAPQIRRFPTIVEYFQSFLGHVAMPAVVVFLGALFWRRGTGAAATLTLVVGTLTGMAAFFTGEVLRLYELQFLYATGIMFGASALLYVTVSLTTPPPDPARVDQVRWTTRVWREDSAALMGKPWWSNPRLQAITLLALTAALVAPFL